MNSNYKYKVGGDEFILSPEEHKAIIDGVKKGQSQFWLREGTLMVNMSITWHVQETNEPTESQQEEMDKQLKLESPKWEAPAPEEVDRRKKILEIHKTATTNGFTAVMGKGEMKKCLDCGVPHFIPAQRTLCLPCLIKK